MTAQGVNKVDTRTRLHLRYDGTDTALSVVYETPEQARADFEAAHLAQFGFTTPETPVIIDSAEVEAVDSAAPDAPEDARAMQDLEAQSDIQTRMFCNGDWAQPQVFRRAALAPGNAVTGPALIIEDNQTIVIEPGWQARITALDHVLLTRHERARRDMAIGTTEADPILLEVFNNLFMSIAEQMGVTLQYTAQSVSIKERLDFSCAVFDASGALVANAPHMPVHLGSMDRSVETVIRLNAGDIHPGDVFALNAPYNGGTHLPDITVVTPVFDTDEKTILFWVAARGHHADVGGSAPGSMTPLATTVDEEGVLIDNFRLVERGTFREAALRALLTDHPCPAATPT